MSPEGIPEDHLRSCPDHNVVSDRDEECPCCVTGVEARPEDVITDVKPIDLRWKIEPETMVEAIELIQEYLDDVGEGPLWIAVARLKRGYLPAGYTEQERWFNVLKYEFGSMEKTLVRQDNAEETIETLRENGYGEDA